MNTTLPTPSETTTDRTDEMTSAPTTFAQTTFAQTDAELTAVLNLLAAGGLAAEAVFDGDAGGCPHCASLALAEAA